MACTYCVEIVHFHEDDVFNHGFFRYGLPPLWTMFMTIHALNNDRDILSAAVCHEYQQRELPLARFNVRPHVQNTTRRPLRWRHANTDVRSTSV